jgi:CRISPR-associated protein Cas2
MMVVMSIEDAPAALRGNLTRWLLEARPNVFVGTVSPRIRDRLWEKSVKACEKGSVLMISSARNEQGFEIRSSGEPSYRSRDFEGLALIGRPLKRAAKASLSAT